MSTFVDLNRASYLRPAPSPDRLNYLSAKYLNMRFIVPPSQTYTISIFDRSNVPGIAFNVYGSRDYWWVVCQYAGVLNPITEFTPGRVLQLPSLSDINLFLTSQEDPQGSNVITI